MAELRLKVIFLASGSVCPTGYWNFIRAYPVYLREPSQSVLVLRQPIGTLNRNDRICPILLLTGAARKVFGVM